MDKIISLFAIARLNHDRYLGIKRHYLAVHLVLISCNLLGLSGLLPSKETLQQDLRLPTGVPRVTAKRTSDVTATPPPTNRNQARPGSPTDTLPTTYYLHSRGVPWKYIAEMIRNDCSFTGSPRLKSHQEVGCPAC